MCSSDLQVLLALRHASLFANLKKCTFCTDELVFLGFVVSKHGVEVDESKIEAIKKWTTPMNISQIRSFLGLAGFYRRFLKDFSSIAASLNDLTKKGVEFAWGAAQDAAFDELKRRLISAPFLVLVAVSPSFHRGWCGRGLGLAKMLLESS